MDKFLEILLFPAKRRIIMNDKQIFLAFFFGWVQGKILYAAVGA
mgnify:CR=1 FL=1